MSSRSADQKNHAHCLLPPPITGLLPSTPSEPSTPFRSLPAIPLLPGYASSVYKAFCRKSSATVVLKVYTLAAVCDLYKFQIYREVVIHSGLQHENIVSLYAAFQEGDKVVLVEVRELVCTTLSLWERWSRPSPQPSLVFLVAR